MSTSKSTRTKILVPLATLLAAGAVAVGSGATFTTSTHNTISSVTSGTLLQENSKDGKAIFTLSNIKPGDTVKGSVTITNSGSLDQLLTVTQDSYVDEFLAGSLSMVVTDTSDDREVFSGSLAEMDAADAIDLYAHDGTTVWADGEEHTYEFAVTLADSAPNADQGKHAEASFTWDGVQDAGVTTDQG